MLNMRFPGGVKKALTLSYDDANYDDMKLMDMMDEYGVKGTFNVSSGIYREEGTEPEGGWPRLTLSEAQKHYKEHGVEIAGAGDGKSRLDDVYAEAFEQLGDFNFFGGVQLTTGDLLTVAQRGVENVQSLTHTNLFIE